MLLHINRLMQAQWENLIKEAVFNLYRNHPVILNADQVSVKLTHFEHFSLSLHDVTMTKLKSEGMCP